MSTGNRMAWLRWGAIAAPVVLIGVFTATNRWSGPKQARADVQGEAPAVSDFNVQDAKEARAIESWVAGHDGPVKSPFEAAPEAAPDTPKPAPRTIEGVTLTGVFRANGTAIAAINGKLVYEGQEIRPGIRVKSIDARARKVVLLLDDGREMEVTPGSSGKSESAGRKGT